MLKGYLSLILHAHLPYVRHPAYPDFMEEDWFFEAITETYLPLLDAFEHLYNQKTPFKLTISISPPLSEMLNDELLKERYSRYLDRLLELSLKEIKRTANNGLFNKTAHMYHEKFQRSRKLYYDVYGRNLLAAFRKFQLLGNLEIMTCAATHGFLPLMKNKESVRAQVMVAVKNYQKHFKESPKGIWLPECAYYPGLEDILAEAGIKFFIVDMHGILNGNPPPLMDSYLPLYCNEKKVAAFGRDAETSRQVWSAKEGYPGDINYREFYRDLGYDAPYDYIKPYLHSDGIRRNTGLKYYRITGDVELHLKQPYSRENALLKTENHADNFISNRQTQLFFLAKRMSAWFGFTDAALPVIIAPYDAELFGHWWFEGPDFIEVLVKKINQQSEFDLITPSQYLKQYPRQQISQPSFSSWGNQGYSDVWLNDKNNWMYRHLHAAENKMIATARKYAGHKDGLKSRVLNQMARELLLAQSSDWAFLVTHKHSECYAQNRFKTHLTRFNRLYDDLNNNTLSESFLNEIRLEDNIFEEIDFRVYAG